MKQAAQTLFDDERSQATSLLKSFRESLDGGPFKTYGAKLRLSYNEFFPIVFSDLASSPGTIAEFLSSQSWSTRLEHKKIQRPATRIKTSDEGGGILESNPTWTLPKLMYYYYWKHTIPNIQDISTRFINSLFNEYLRGYLNSINSQLFIPQGYDVSFGTLKKLILPYVDSLLLSKALPVIETVKFNLKGVQEIDLSPEPTNPIPPGPEAFLVKGYENLTKQENPSEPK